MEISNDNAVKKTKRLTSVVWNYFERVKKADAQYAICSHCKKKLSGSSNSGTTHLRNHLLRCLKRSNYDVSQILSAKRKRKETLQSNNVGIAAIDYEEDSVKDEILSPIPLNFVQGPKKQEIGQSINIGSLKFDQDRSRMDLAGMIMLHGYSLSMVDHAGFQVFVKNLQPLFEFNDFDAMEQDCLSIYSKEKQKLYTRLNHLRGQINLSVGIWDSSEGSNFLYLTANYIDEDWTLQKKLLKFTAIEPSETDNFHHGVVIKSLTDWGINGKLFSVTFDGCDAYEFMLSNIKNLLAQNRNLLLKSGELFDMRCVTHLLKYMSQEVIELCREIISKVRDIVRHTKSSISLLSQLTAIAGQVGINGSRHLVLDFPKRWDSTYRMLEAAIDYRSVFSLLKDHDSSSYSKSLSETEWELASSVTGFFRLIFEFRNIVVGNKHPSANIFFPEMCEMHLQLIKWCKSPDDFLKSVALKMKYKFDRYWNKCSLVLAIATVLDPRFKMKLVEYYYQQIYGSCASGPIVEVSSGLRKLFDEYYSVSSCDQVLRGSNHGFRDKLKGFDEFLSESSSQCHSISSSELEKYLAESVFPRNNDFNILNWWKVNTPRYPILSSMARDVLSISVSTAFECEWGFRNSRSCLSPESREALVCGQDWLRVESEGTHNSYLFVGN